MAGGSDTAKIRRVIHNRHKEVDGANNADTVAHMIDCRIIAGVVAHQQLLVRCDVQPGLEDGVENPWGDFAATAGPVAILG